jgi:hypothetical protein
MEMKRIEEGKGKDSANASAHGARPLAAPHPLIPVMLLGR